MSGEAFAILATLVGAGVIILVLDWIARNASEALGDEVPDAKRRGGGPKGRRALGTHSTSSVSHSEGPVK